MHVKQCSESQYTGRPFAVQSPAHKSMELGKPHWLRRSLSYNKIFFETKKCLDKLNLNTVCREAVCPNVGECWSQGEATFIVLGKNCTRNCRFCNVESNNPESVDKDEPRRIAQAVKKLNLDYAVVTSVTRDDLADYGAEHFVNAAMEIKKISPATLVELLIPDMKGNVELLKYIAGSGADVIGHNIETAASLYPLVRQEASYEISLNVLRVLKQNKVLTKSAIMIGLGETKDELINVFKDIKEAGVSILHIGQYLRPSKQHIDVNKYYSPDEFKSLAVLAKQIGFKVVNSGPLVRSSYKAKESYARCSLLQ